MSSAMKADACHFLSRQDFCKRLMNLMKNENVMEDEPCRLAAGM